MPRRLSAPMVALAVLASCAALAGPLAPAGAAPAKTVAVRTTTKTPTVDEAALTKKIAAYLKTRKGSASVSFQDLATGEWYTYRPGRTYSTASIVKVDILATLLLQHQRNGTTITKRERALASRMIRESDNDAANVLWLRIGGWKGLAAANKRFGMEATTESVRYGQWGGTRTTAADQVRLLRTLSRTDSVLKSASRDYVFSLMRTVTKSQRWGVPAAADRRTVAKVKNGWAPQRVDGGKWEINSIGLVRVEGHLVALSVLTRANPDMAYGQATVKKLTTLVSTALRSAD